MDSRRGKFLIFLLLDYGFNCQQVGLFTQRKENYIRIVLAIFSEKTSEMTCFKGMKQESTRFNKHTLNKDKDFKGKIQKIKARITGAAPQRCSQKKMF